MQDQPDKTNLPQLNSNGVPRDVSSDLSIPLLQNQPSGPQDPQAIAIPDEAEEVDLIEKEWILKAKEIVEHTADDPYLQQQQMSHLKADYISKRYGREVKRPGE
jgi:hypothetical protein